MFNIEDMSAEEIREIDEARLQDEIDADHDEAKFSDGVFDTTGKLPTPWDGVLPSEKTAGAW